MGGTAASGRSGSAWLAVLATLPGGAGWACVAPANRVTCTYDATLAVGAKSTITLVTTVVGHAGQQITGR